MSNQNRTPGPWRWIDSPAHDDYEGPLARLVGADGTEVMNFGDSTQYYPTQGSEPNDADKRLIAAAPAMLAALLKAQEFIVNGVEFGYISLPDKGDSALDTLPMIEAAIEAATSLLRG